MLLILAALALATPAAAQRLPDTVEWSVPSAAPPAGAPVMAGTSVVVPLSTGAIAAHALRDGALLWSTELRAEQSLAADGDRVYVASGEAIHALGAVDGRVAWRAPAGARLTAPPLAHAGWVIAAAGGELIAIRASDGTVVWRKHVGPVEFRPSLDGDLLVVSIVDGQIAALDVRDGSPRWTRRLERIARRTAGRSAAASTSARRIAIFYALALVVGPHRGSPESCGGAARGASR